jgi:hypothetical protein
MIFNLILWSIALIIMIYQIKDDSTCDMIEYDIEDEITYINKGEHYD